MSMTAQSALVRIKRIPCGETTCGSQIQNETLHHFSPQHIHHGQKKEKMRERESNRDTFFTTFSTHSHESGTVRFGKINMTEPH